MVPSKDPFDDLDEHEDQPLLADQFTQPPDEELLVLQHRLSLPEIPGVSYRCPVPIEGAA